MESREGHRERETKATATPAPAEEPVAVERDPQTFGALYERYAARVHRHVLQRVRNPATAEDLTAQVFLNAWQAVERHGRIEGRPVLAWLFQIANNLVVDHVRSGGRLLDEQSGIEQLPADSDPEEAALATALRRELSRYIARLKPEQRLILTLHMVDGLRYQEIAELMGKSAGAVRVVHFRALAALRRELKARADRA